MSKRVCVQNMDRFLSKDLIGEPDFLLCAMAQGNCTL